MLPICLAEIDRSRPFFLGLHVEGTAPPLVLHGEPGSDLTPLIARWNTFSFSQIRYRV